MNVNVLSKTRRLASITNFYFNKRVNILFRIKSFARRIRFHCKLHNQILYENDNNLIEQNKYKLLNDDVDYFKTTQFIIEDLVTKSSFLSNHDSILILDILSRIKNPLERICSKNNDSNFTTESNPNEVNNTKYGTIRRMITRGQTSLLKYLIKSEESMTLTDNERYYLIIALSRDCGLISLNVWLKLFENVYNSLVTKSPDSLYGHKPYEIANLLLIYDQISRWSYKRQNNQHSNSNNYYKRDNNKIINNHNIKSEMETETENILKDEKDITHSKQLNDLKTIENEIQLKKLDNELELKSLERRTCNPFNLDLINVGIYRLEKCIDQLKAEKIIKILYLANSRESYTNNLFQNSLIHFESEQLLKSFELSQIHTLFNLFSRAYYYHLLRHIESCIYSNNIGCEDLESLVDEVQKFNRLESMCLCTIIVSLEYLRRLCKINMDYFLEDELFSEGIQEIFGKDYEWNDILTFLSNRITNVENMSTHQIQGERQVSGFIGKLNTFSKFNEYLLKLFDINNKYDNRVKRVKFCKKLIDNIILHTTHSLNLEDSTINQHCIDTEPLKQVKSLNELKELDLSKLDIPISSI